MRRLLSAALVLMTATVIAGAAQAVTGTNTITTFAGRSMFPGFGGDGGPATRALFGGFNHIAVDARGNVFIADTAGYRIRKVNAAGKISTFACNGKQGDSGDGGPARSARCRPNGIAVDNGGNVYFTDENRVRRVGANGRITAFAGNGNIPPNADPIPLEQSGDGGLATKAAFFGPEGIAVDGDGNVYIADTEDQRVRKVDRNGIITAFAGSGKNGFSGDGGPAAKAQLRIPFDVAADRNGNVYIADTGNGRVRKVAPNGVITTIAGNGRDGTSGDGGAATAAALKDLGIAVDSRNGDVYIGGANRVRKITTAGTITTVAGTGACSFGGDYGKASKARMCNVVGVAVDPKGNVLAVDLENRRVRKIWNGPAPKKPSKRKPKS
jgi:trimeric autotransporter adhesin